jgi:iron complex outermembrane receptor protein
MPVKGLKLSVGYAQLKGRSDASPVADGKVGTDLDGANISPNRVNLAAIYQRGAISARLQSNFYLSRTFKSNEITLDQRNNFGGYNVTDASIRYQTGIGGFTFSVQNLLDEHYIDYASDTQRATDNFFYFAGRGRNFTLTWDYRF